MNTSARRPLRALLAGAVGALALFFARPAAAQCPPAWGLASLTGPSPRTNLALSYDSKRERVVLFSGSTPPGDTWEWNGAAWSLASTTGPSARAAHSMAFDANKGVTVLFGGSGPSELGDTWLWDGSAWKLALAIISPSARSSSSMAYDPIRQRVVLFSGRIGSGFAPADTWEWDGSNWALMATAGPTPRFEHRCVFDASRGRVVLFGGYDGTLRNDLWEWNGVSWTPIAQGTPPPARYAHAMAYDTARSRLVVFGGVGESFCGIGDTWEFDGVSWSQIASAGPTGRADADAVFDAARSQVLLFGGNALCAGVVGDTWLWSVKPIIYLQGAECVGSLATFKTNAPGTGSPTFQWRRGGLPLTDGPTGTGSTITGSQTATMQIQGVSSADDGGYDCVVTNACASTPGNTIDLYTCYANCDCSPSPSLLSIDDFICFQTLFALADPYADCDQDSFLSIDDFICYQTLFAIGC